MEPGVSKFRGDMKNVLMEASDSGNLYFIIVNNAHILTKYFIPLHPCLHPAKRWFDWTKIGTIVRNIYNSLATSRIVSVSAKAMA